MSIEFLCSQCGATLRVADEFAGRQARCPTCSTVSPVPTSRNPFSAHSIPEPAPTSVGNPFESPQDWNPYQSPQSEFVPSAKPMMGQLGHAEVDIGSIFNHSVELWKMHLGLLVGATFTVFAIRFGLGAVLGIVSAIAAQSDPDAGRLVDILGNFIGNVFGIYLAIGETQLILKLARGQPAGIGDVFGGGSRFLPTLGFSILAGLALVLGFLLLIVPGIIMLLVCWPSYWLVVDGRARVMESFSLAADISRGNRTTTFVLAVLGFGINLLGFVALCIGLLFSVPLVNTMWVVAYLMMSGQLPVGAPARKTDYASYA